MSQMCSDGVIIIKHGKG